MLEALSEVRVCDIWPAEGDQVLEAGPVSHEDADLVRMYLSQLGKRPLLTFAQEQEIGRRMEERRADLLTALAAFGIWRPSPVVWAPLPASRTMCARARRPRRS